MSNDVQLQVSGLVKRFGAETVFDGIGLSARKGEVVVVPDVMVELAGQGITMVIVTHEMQFARAIADRIRFLERGKDRGGGSSRGVFHHTQNPESKRFLAGLYF